MSRFRLLRALLVLLVVMIGGVTFAFIDGELSYIQTPIDLIRNSLSLSNTEDEFGDGLDNIDLSSIPNGSNPVNPSQAPSMKCKCRLVWQGIAQRTLENLNIFLPWLNQTNRQDLPRHHPNIPTEFLYNASQGKVCDMLPTLFTIDWRNRHWQQVKIDSDNELLLYSAHFDPNIGGDGPCVRVLGFTRSKDPKRPWCHLWYTPQDPPTVTRVQDMVHMDYQSRNSNRQMPYMLTCPLPPDMPLDRPAAVSLVATPCSRGTSLLKVNGAMEREPSAYVDGQAPKEPHTHKKGWKPAVCGPALYYYSNDFSWRMVEWLELLKVMGFGQVFLYKTSIHPNLTKVLDYYKKEGFVEVTDYNYPPPYLSEPSMQRLWTLVERPKMFAQENIYFTDCLLRHMHQYRYIAHLDPDEVPIIPHHDNMTHFLDDILNNTKTWCSGFKLQWNIFYDDQEPKDNETTLPKPLWILRHTRRLKKNLAPSPGMYKTIYDMDTARAVFSHGVIKCTTGWCAHTGMTRIHPDKAYIGHYTRKCGKNCSPGTPMIDELALHRYKDQVSTAVQNVLSKLKLL